MMMDASPISLTFTENYISRFKNEQLKDNMKKITFLFVLFVNLGGYWLTQANPSYASGGAIRLVSPSGANSGNCVVTPCATIAYAHSQAANGDVILLAAGTYTENGISISKNVIISGAGVNNTIVQAHANADSASNRVFTINAGVSVAIDDITIRHGKIVDSWSKGGGILNNGALSIINCIVHSNVVEHDPFDEFYLVSQGGGIYNAGSLLVISSTLDNNTTSKNMSSGEGGGIYNLGTLQVLSSTFGGNWSHYGAGVYNANTASALATNVIFTRNLGSHVYYASGGGVYNAGVFTLTNSTVMSQAFGATNAQGGGLFNADTGMAYIDATAFQSNTVGVGAGQLYGKGGAIYNAGGMTLQNSNLAYNQAGGSGNGGAIYNLGSSAYLTISNSILRNNAVGSTGDAGTGEGGAIYNGSNAVLQLATSQLLSNTASTSNKAAGLANVNSVTLSQTLIAYSTGRDCTGTISDAGYNASQDNTCGFGAPQYRYVATNGADTTNCLLALAPCRTVKYAVGQAVSADKVLIRAGIYEEFDIAIGKNLSIVGNSSADTIIQAQTQSRYLAGFSIGQIFRIGGSDVQIENLTLRYGRPYNGDAGGAIRYYGPSGHLMIISSNLSDNATLTDSGGAIYAYGHLAIISSTLNNNWSAWDGGAIASNSTPINITSSIFNNNYAGRFGGAISSDENMVNIISSTFTNNRSVDSGGALKFSLDNFSVNITSSIISNNLSSKPGGGIYKIGNSPFIISSSSIISNSTDGPDGLGGGIYLGGNMIISNSVIAGNSASQGGGGIYTTASHLTMTNSQVSNNNGGGIQSVSGNSYSMKITASTIYGNNISSNGPVYIRSSITQNCNATLYDEGNNISTDACGFTALSSRNNVTNLRLLPLDNTGGFYTPGIFSLARDAYNVPCATSTDQRGVARPINGKCDIGAIEGDLMPPYRAFVPNSRRRAASGW